MWLLITKQKVFNIRFLYFVKIFKVITLNNIKVRNIISNKVADIMLYRFISFIFDINALNRDLQSKNKKSN